MTITTKRTVAIAIAAALALGACGGGATPAPGTAAPATTPATPGAGGVTGSITVSGSSTVEPISTGVAEAFKTANPGFNYTIEGPGTGDGFKRFCNNETDISNASRHIKDEEKALCEAAGIKYIELKIAFDGMTVMTSPRNTAVACLSLPDLYALIGPESTGFDTWDKAAGIAGELGSKTAFPAAPLAIFGPGEESGTFDSFVELAVAKTAEARGRKGETTRPDYTASANDNAIIEGITGSDTSLGWVGFAFAEENKGRISEIAIAKDANGACVAPTAETIADGSYPLSRPLYIYVNAQKAKSNPAVAAYLDFYLAEGTISSVLKKVPYVNLPAAELAQARETWKASR